MAVRESFTVEFSVKGAQAIHRATAAIGRAFDKLKRQNQQLFTDLRGIAKRLAQFSALGIGAIATGAALAVRNVDKLAKSATKLGVSTQKMDAFGKAAQMAGVSTETLQQGFADFQKRLGDATAGKGEAAEAFKLLGLDPNKLERGGVEFALEKTLEKLVRLRDPVRLINEMVAKERAGTLNLSNAELNKRIRLVQAGQGSQAGQLRAAEQLFGESGRQLLPFINQGGMQNVSRIMERAKALGIGPTDELGERTQALNDALYDVRIVLEQTFTRVATSILTRFTPAIQEMGRQLETLIAAMGGGDGIVNALLNAMQDLVNRLQQWRDSFWGTLVTQGPMAAGQALGRQHGQAIRDMVSASAQRNMAQRAQPSAYMQSGMAITPGAEFSGEFKNTMRDGAMIFVETARAGMANMAAKVGGG